MSSATLDAIDVGSLPAAVGSFAERALPAGGAIPSQTRLTQTGTMWSKPGGRALRFRAVEEFATQEVAFAWRARFAIAGVPLLSVVDRYAAGEGSLEARLFGLLPVMRKRGQVLSEGEALRYLGELPFNPAAMLLNRRLLWRELDDDAVEVSTRVGEATVSLRLEFDAEGDIVRISTPARPRGEEGNVLRPWVGEFSRYATVGATRIPTRGEVRWELPSGPFTYWRCEVTSFA